MVRRTPKKYLVKVRGKRLLMDKPAIKQRNLEIVMEFKGADKERRGELLSEYVEMNRSFVTYFPMFHGDYRDEIISTFVTMIPSFFEKFDPSKGAEINSYLAKFAKKNAVREFLYLLPTVMHNRWYRDESGRMVVEKAHCMSIDSLHDGSDAAESDVGDSGIDQLLGQYVFKDFLNSGGDGASAFLDGSDSYSHHFTGMYAEIIKDFESGLRWTEVQKKHGLSSARFLTIMSGISMQLQRMLKDEREIRVLNKRERAVRRQSRRKVQRRTSLDLHAGWEGAGGVWEAAMRHYADPEGDFGGAESPAREASIFMEDEGSSIDGDGEGA